MLDLDDYPDGTKEILLVLYEYEQREDNHGDMMKRRMLASSTSLNKEQVRYRLSKLIDDHHVIADERNQHNQRVMFYGLLRSGKEAAEAIAETESILGEIPEEVSKEDLLELSSEVRQLRSKLGYIDRNYVKRLKINKIRKRIDDLEEATGLADSS